MRPSRSELWSVNRHNKRRIKNNSTPVIVLSVFTGSVDDSGGVYGWVVCV